MKVEKQPNIAFVGGKDGFEPLREISDGMTTIVLPEKQKSPFYHAEARRIIRAFPKLYKPVLETDKFSKRG